MILRPRTIVAACGVGQDLHLAVVEASPLGVRTRPGPVIRDAAHATGESLRRAGAALPRATSVVFVCPSEVTAVRPIGVGVSGFVGARADLHRSVGKLVPIPPENALIGLVERHGEDGEGAPDSAGFLCAARRDAIDTWSDRVRSVVGRAPDTVVSPAMALIGLGGQRTETMVVLERTVAGGQVAHIVRWGRVAELAQPTDSERIAAFRAAGATIRSLPSRIDEGAMGQGAAISGAELAVAGAMAMVVGDREFVPLAGSPPRNAPAWVGGVAAGIAAAALVWGAASIRDWRYERAIERLAHEGAGLDAEVARVQAMRGEVTRLTALVRDGVDATIRDWTPRTIDLAEASRIIPPDGFVYRIGANASGVTINGEAPKASAVLAALEASPRFSNARAVDPTTTNPARGTESFGIRADYEAAPKTGGTP